MEHPPASPLPRPIPPVTNARRLVNSLPRDEHFDPSRPVPWIRSQANILVDGPAGGFLLRSNRKRDAERQLERIMHLTVRVPNTAYTAWSVFRREREFTPPARSEANLPAVPGAVLRRAQWHGRPDLAKAGAKTYTALVPPEVSETVCYLDESACAGVFAAVMQLDQLLAAGLALQAREAPPPDWSEVAFARTYNLQGITMFWSSERAHPAGEAALFAVRDAIDQALDQQAGTRPVAQIRLQYAYTAWPARTILVGPDQP